MFSIPNNNSLKDKTVINFDLSMYVREREKVQNS